MITLLLFFAKAKSIISTIASFILTHWRIFAVLAILAYTYYSFNKLHTQRDDAINALSELNRQIQLETIKREAENKIKAELGKLQVKNITEKHQQELAKILKRGKQHETNIMRDFASERDILQNDIRNSEAARMSKNDTDRITSDNNDPALFRQLQTELNTCREAGAIAALDYNFCKTYVDNEQLRLGVEK